MIWLPLIAAAAIRVLAKRYMPEDAELLDGGYGELYPEGMRKSLKRLAPLHIPIYITENGIPDSDDDQRPRALILHLHQAWQILQNNLPLKGYYHWTLTDNFEWAEGWSLRFGLIALDPETQQRSRRPSADLYAVIAKGNAITPELINAYAPEFNEVLYPDIEVIEWTLMNWIMIYLKA